MPFNNKKLVKFYLRHNNDDKATFYCIKDHFKNKKPYRLFVDLPILLTLAALILLEAWDVVALSFAALKLVALGLEPKHR